MYRLLTVDFDGTFQPGGEDDVDIKPAVYLVDNEDYDKAVSSVSIAKTLWEDSDGDNTLQEEIEGFWRASGINWLYVGIIDLPYEMRSEEYLEDVVYI